MKPETSQMVSNALNNLEAGLASALTYTATKAYIAGDLFAQKQIGVELGFNVVKKAAEDYAKEYRRQLVEEGGSYIVKNGNLEFKAWFYESNRKARDEVADLINTGIREGRSMKDTEKDLRKYFNQRKRHAEMVARTETAKIQDIASTRRMEEQGVDKVQWITAEDERVRDSHAERHMQVFDIRSSPSLGEPNCRCVKTPYIE